MARILIVDRSVDTLEFFALVLSAAGHLVQTEKTLEAALAACRKASPPGPPELVLVDVFGDAKEVRQFVLQIRDVCAGARVVLFSSGLLLDDGGIVGADEPAEARALGADLVLRKPIDTEALLETIAAVLDRAC